MNKFLRSSAFLMIIIMLVMMVGGATAQETGSGGVLIEGNTGGDPNTFNPLLGNDTVSSDVYDLMYPEIIELNPTTLEEEPGVAGGLAESWEYDETGTVLTLKIREGLFWSDGVDITVDDYLWAVNAVRSGVTTSPRTTVFYELDDGTKAGGFVHDIVKIDDYTLEITLGDAVEDEDGNVVELTPNCVALSDLNDISVVPAHLYAEAFGEDYAAMDADPYFVPSATFSEFTDPFFESGVQVSLIAQDPYQDAVMGNVLPSEWIYQNVEDRIIEFERFKAGELSYVASVEQSLQNDFRGTEGFQIWEQPSNGYSYIGWNNANPDNPMDGVDENGDPQEQDPHPIFGDKLVRQALSYAIDVEAMIGSRPDGDNPATGILEGNGFRVATHNHAASWADTPFEPVPYDPDMALELLAEAGWTDGDGDGVLECNGCKYAEEGTPFEFELITNSGNTIRERIGTTVKAQLEEIGIVVNFQASEFGTIVQTILSQNFDAVIIGWSTGLPWDPDGRGVLGIEADRVGAGLNMVSYHNPKLDDLWAQATTVPGCAREDRIELYQQAMEELREDQPYTWLFISNVMFAAQGNIENFDPLAYDVQWNMDAWSISD